MEGAVATVETLLPHVFSPEQNYENAMWELLLGYSNFFLIRNMPPRIGIGL